jgi:serine/threonine-protein kinase
LSAIYRKGEVLGWGSLARVFKGWDELLDRPVAIKELVQPFAGSEAFLRAFVGQALRMVDIVHRHVLTTYGVETARATPAVLREIADETVGQQLLEGAIAPEAVLRILRHALSGLDAIHGRELLHRAIKPENLFVCGDVYKVGDFGVPALESGPQTPLRRLKYAAPETLNGNEPVGPASDLYSLGLVMYELLLGTVRFEQAMEKVLQKSEVTQREEWDEEEDSAAELWPTFHSSVVELPPIHELEPSIPVAFSLTLQRMVHKNASERYGSCREVLAAMGAAGLVEILGASQGISVPPSALNPPGAEKPLIAPRRTGVAAWFSGGLALALLTAGGAWFGAHFGRWDVRSDQKAISRAAMPDAGTLADALLSLRSEQGLTFEITSVQSEGRPRLPVETPLRFRVTSDRPSHLALFGLSSDGVVTCLYPDGMRPVVRIAAGGTLILPTPEDRRAGFELVASKPLGRQLLFLLAADEPLPPLPPGNAASGWYTEYPASQDGDSPADHFVEWVARLRREHPDHTRLAVQEIDIVAGP